MSQPSRWKMVGGTMSAVVILTAGVATAQSGPADDVKLDDPVPITQVTTTITEVPTTVTTAPSVTSTTVPDADDSYSSPFDDDDSDDTDDSQDSVRSEEHTSELQSH